jgi:alanine dehydrogenase
MRIIDAEATRRALDFPSLMDAIAEQFRTGAELPLRHHHNIAKDGEDDATILIMPAWEKDGYLGIKLVTVTPGNLARGLPSVMAFYALSSGVTGEPLAMIDGPVLTGRRTAAASGLAARYLARDDASKMLMVGTGVMAPNLIRAHAATRPIRDVIIWGRNSDKALKLVVELEGDGFSSITIADDLETAVRAVDIISCATHSTTPLVQGAWLHEGQHVDLVGAFKPEMRESDDECMRRARVFVDTRDGAFNEGGDVVQAIQSGALSADGIQADLFQLCRGEIPGRTSADEITLFKSSGTAIEDLAAAKLAFERS